MNCGLIFVMLLTVSPEISFEIIPEQATFDWLMPGPRFESPLIVLESYWQAMNEQNLPKVALHFSYVTLFDAIEVAREMLFCNVKNCGIKILETTIVNDTLIHFQYLVRLERGQFKSGDLMVYNPNFGWRILAPMTDSPSPDQLGFGEIGPLDSNDFK